MDIQFVASVAPIVRDTDEARWFYRDTLGLSFEGEEGDYVFTHKLEGTKHFGLWPLSEAANACFGTTEWPADIPVPQASIEFEVDIAIDYCATRFSRKQDEPKCSGRPD
jgi:catechol 2,3-dioxygenase-like lactoylglutathione lyase family enzyme